MLRNLCVTAALAAAGAAVFAETPAQQPIFRSGTELATIDVRVVDKDGAPITDLQPNEIQVLDDGVSRTVRHLRHVTGQTAAAPDSRWPGGVSTNRAAPRGQLYVLLFDQHHITPGHEIGIRDAAMKFLQGHATARDRVAVYGVPGPGPSQSFTSDLGAVNTQLRLVRGTLEKMVTGTVGDMTIQEAYEIQRGNEAVLNRFLAPSDDNGNSFSARTSALVDMLNSRGGRIGGGGDPDTIRRMVQENAQTIVTRADGESRRFLQQAATILRSLSAVDGRKTVLLFSEGFFNDNLAPDVQDLVAAAAESYAVIDPFDLNARQDTGGTEARGNDVSKEVSSLIEPLGTMATETGGALQLDASSRADRVFDALDNPNGDYYIVGFDPPAGEAVKYKHVRVTVTRPGARVKTRSGYSDERREGLPKRAAIDAALASPYGTQGLTVEYTTYVSRGDEPGRERVVLSLDAELPIAPDAAGSENSSNADVVFIVREAHSGAVAASGSGELPLPRTADTGAATGTGSYHVQFAVPPGDYVMRAVVREPGGLIGSADRAFHVMSLSGPEIGATDLLINNASTPFPLRGHVYADGALAAGLRFYGRTPQQMDDLSHRAIGLTLRGVAAPNAPGISAPADFGAVRQTDVGAYRDVSFRVPLAGVAPGEYIAIVASPSSAAGDPTPLVYGSRRVIVEAGPAPAMAQPAGVVAIDTEAPSLDAMREAAITAARTDLAEALLTSARRAADPSAAWIVSGLTALRAGDAAAAERDLARAFDLKQDARVAFYLGWARRAIGAAPRAASAFRSAAFLDPAFVPAHLALAHTYLDMHEPALAVQALNAGLAARPDAIELKSLLETIK